MDGPPRSVVRFCPALRPGSLNPRRVGGVVTGVTITVSSGDLSLTGATGANATALEELFRLRYDAFLRVAVAITGSSDVGRDAVQEGLARALAGRASFRGSGSLEAWLWRTVVNAAR